MKLYSENYPKTLQPVVWMTKLKGLNLKLKGNFGQYIDLVPSKPDDEDMELDEDLQAEPDAPEPHAEGAPRKVRR